MSKLVPSNQDTSYGVAAAQVDVTIDELQVLCREHLPRLVVTEQQQQQLALWTAQQANDPSGECGKQRKIRITASHFGEVCKQRAEFGPLTVRILYSSTRETSAMRYGCIKEGIARAAYTEYLKSEHHPDATVTMTGLHVDLKVKYEICVHVNTSTLQDSWLVASPDGLLYDPSADDPLELLEIKCPFLARDTSVKDLCQKSSFFLTDTDETYHLKPKHNYYQVQGQLHILRPSWCDFVVYTPHNSQTLVIHRISVL